MNHGDIVCLRYVDDFLILGPSRQAINAAFKRANKILAADGLSAYVDNDSSKKAKSGPITQKFEYLGLEICGQKIKPGEKTQKEIFSSIENVFQESLTTNFAEVNNNSKEKHSLLKTLKQVNDKLKGWGNQYYFCNDDELWLLMDRRFLV